jgi:hypothetical protein
MRRDYSFNEMPQSGATALKKESRPIYSTGGKSHGDQWTNKRIEEIKKKYEAPSLKTIPSPHPAANKSGKPKPVDTQTSNSSFCGLGKGEPKNAGGSATRKDYSVLCPNNINVDSWK